MIILLSQFFMRNIVKNRYINIEKYGNFILKIQGDINIFIVIFFQIFLVQVIVCVKQINIEIY